jgi:PAP2 superfamily
VLGAAWLLAGAVVLQAPAPPSQAPPTQPPADAPGTERPLLHLFQNLGHDLRRLPSPETAAILAVGVGSALAMHPVDDNLHDRVVAQGPTDYVRVGNLLGDGWLQGGVAIGTYVVGRMRDDRFVTHLGSDLIRSQALNAVLTRGLKLAAQRNRPHGGSDAMPSGHTSAAFATAVVLQEHYGWKTGVAAYAAAGFVGWSRIRDDRHWLTDVIVGATVGVIAGRTVVRGHGQQWVVVPAATARSAEIRVIRVFR